MLIFHCYVTLWEGTFSLHGVWHVLYFRQGIKTTNHFPIHFPIQPTQKTTPKNPWLHPHISDLLVTWKFWELPTHLVLGCCWSPPWDFAPMLPSKPRDLMGRFTSDKLRAPKRKGSSGKTVAFLQSLCETSEVYSRYPMNLEHVSRWGIHIRATSIGHLFL